jgi:hypothetical protein
MSPLRKALRVLAAVAVAALAHPVAAAPCAGFVDVDDASTFCPSVEWMKNRAITLGCVGANVYCPTDPVNRLSMSAFLQRLGIALTPTTIGSIDVPPGAALTLANAPTVCRTLNVFPSATFPRLAHGKAIFSFVSSGETDVAVQLVETSDGGTTWTPVSPLQSVSAVDQARASLSVILPPRNLGLNLSYEYALRVTRVAGSATAGNPSSYSCRYRLLADNRNPGAPPFDE